MKLLINADSYQNIYVPYIKYTICKAMAGVKVMNTTCKAMAGVKVMDKKKWFFETTLFYNMIDIICIAKYFQIIKSRLLKNYENL